MGSRGDDAPPPVRTRIRPRRSRLATLGAVLAVVLPPVGVVVSIVAIRRIKGKHPFGRGRAIFGIACGALLTVPFVLFVVLVIKYGGNAAQDEAHPFVASVQHAGGHKLCDNGDGGYGPDNRQPWYQVYIAIADRPGLTDEIKGAAARGGYPLERDTERIAALKRADPAPHAFGPTFNPKADYLVARASGNRLEVTIERDTAIPLYCRSGGYGRRRQTGPDEAIVSIDMQLPRR